MLNLSEKLRTCLGHIQMQNPHPLHRSLITLISLTPFEKLGEDSTDLDKRRFPS
jgi:hypothetical protein